MSTPCEPVAVVGMACVFPGARDVAAFWRLIVGGHSAIGEVPETRWNPRDYDLRATRGGFIDGLAHFDPLSLGVMPASVEQGDAEQFLVLALAQAALRDAGLEHANNADDEAFWARAEIVIGRGAYLGNAGEALYNRNEGAALVFQALQKVAPDLSPAQNVRARELIAASYPELSADILSSAIPNLTAGRVANRFGMMGANYTVDGACASSLLALDHVMRDLQSRRCDVGVAAAVHLCQKPHFWHAFEVLGALSESQRSAPFDADADGLLMGEGAGALVLKRLDDALKNGDRIYGVVRSVGIASDGRGVGLMAPRREGQVLALQNAYAQAGVSPDTISLIEAHGTATPVGDQVELETLRAFFGARDAHKKTDFAGIALGSVKSQIGHAMPAAGMAGLIKTLLALHHRTLPPTINIARPHALLENSRFALNTRTRPFLAPFIEEENRTVARAGVNAFGFGGINAHAILEAAPEASPEDSKPTRKIFYFTPRAHELLVFPAQSAAALRENIARWQTRLHSSDAARPEYSEEYLRDASWTAWREVESAQITEATTGATSDGENAIRLAVVARDVEDLKSKLARALELLDEGANVPRVGANSLPRAADDGIYLSFGARAGKVAVLFPGMGFPGLAAGYTSRLAELCAHFPIVRSILEDSEHATSIMPEAADDAVYPLRHQLFPPPLSSRAELDQIERELAWSSRTSNGMMAANLATWELIRLFGIAPDFMAGFSLGEWSALVASGALGTENLSAFLRGIREGAQGRDVLTSDNWGAWGMIARSPEEVEARFGEVEGTVTVTMDTAPHQVFVGGEKTAVAALVAIFKAEGAWAQVMPFPAVHTPLASEAVENLCARGEELEVHAPRVPVYQGSVGKPFPTEPDELRQTLFNSIAKPVHIRQTVRALFHDGARVFVQVGSGSKVLLNVRSTLTAEGVDESAFRAIGIDGDKRGGLAHLLYALAELWSAGVPIRLDALFENRACRDLREREEKTSAHLLSFAPSRPHFDGESFHELRDLLRPREYSNGAMNGQDSGHIAPEIASLETPNPVVEMQRTMQQFLQMQREEELVESQMMAHFLETQSVFASLFSAPSTRASQLEKTQSQAAPRYPLLGEFVAHTPQHNWVSRLLLDLESQPFLRDHCLIRIPDELSTLRPREERLPTLALTVGLEIMAESAATLWPCWIVVSLENIEARRWIALEDRATLPLRIEAQTLRVEADEIEVSIGLHPEYSQENANETASEAALLGRVILRRAFQKSPAPLDAKLEYSPAHSVAEYYAGPLFHGPSFRVIKAWEKMSDEAISAELEIPFAVSTLGEDLAKNFAAPIFDAAFLDGLGQLPGYPVSLDNWQVFPSRLKKLERFSFGPPPGARVRAVCKFRRSDARRLIADMDVFDEAGNLWLRVEGWLDWRSLWPKDFLSFEFQPRFWYAAARVPEIERLIEHEKIENCACRRVAIRDLNGANAEWLARSYLRPREWCEYSDHRREDWLLGRIAAKDAVRDWLQTQRGVALHPLEVEVENEERGAPRARFYGHGLENFSLEISIAHLSDEAIAAAASRPAGIDIARIEPREKSWRDLVFDDAEQRVLAPCGEEDAWLHRAWCAKEAAMKACGCGLETLPQFRVARVENVSAILEISHGASMLRARTWIENGRAFALCFAPLDAL